MLFLPRLIQQLKLKQRHKSRLKHFNHFRLTQVFISEQRFNPFFRFSVKWLKQPFKRIGIPLIKLKQPFDRFKHQIFFWFKQQVFRQQLQQFRINPL